MAWGKERPGFMSKSVYPFLGAPSERTRVGPGVGLDNGVVSVGGGRVMILTTDPVSMIPPLGARLSSWLSVHLIGSDFTSSGLDPELGVFSYNFPSQMSESQRGSYLRGVGEACRELGVAIAGGHTGSYPGGGLTVIGSGTMLGFAPEGGFVTPAMAGEGDTVLMTKHAGIEAALSMATSFPELSERLAGARQSRGARGLASSCTTVQDARAARKGGLRTRVTSMHDATEGGVLGALAEMAAASGKAFHVEEDRIPLLPEVREVCRAFGIDPLRSMGEGALLITCRDGEEQGVEARLAGAGIGVRRIGRVRRGEGLWISRGGERPRRFKQTSDPYWKAYAKALEGAFD